MLYIEKYVPLQLLLVVVASFLIGLEMEGRKAGGKAFSPGGVRTFPLICLGGFLLAVLSGKFPGAFVVGLAVVGVWMALLYRAKVAAGNYGITTESYAMVTYVIGGLAAAQMWWLVAALTVLMVMLQEFKDPLENLAIRLPGDELVTIAKFVLLSAVILPLMPDQPVTRFALNPQKIWLIVVAVAAISYAGYLLRRLTRRNRHSVLLTGLLGGVYSSTVTTVVLARRARDSADAYPPGVAAGGILAASGVMNVRLLALLGIFAPALMRQVLWPLGAAAVVGIVVGVLLSFVADRGSEGREGREGSRGERAPDSPGQEQPPLISHHASPLELRTAIGFAVIFVIILSLTHEAGRLWGGQGLYGLGTISGLVDVDAFVLSLTQLGSSIPAPGASGLATLPAAGAVEPTAPGTVALALVLSASANDLAKGVYAAMIARRRAGLYALVLLSGLAVVTLVGWWVFLQLGWS